MRFCLLLVLSVLALPLAAQPTPEAFLGYPLGTQFTQHHRILAYAEAVAEASPRALVVPYGVTYEGRPLVVVVVASARNMARLEAIQQSNLALTGLRDGPVLEDAPAIVWLSYNVHGNEAVSSEAFMPTLHALTDPDNAQAQAWLENTVVILDPMLNPDGRERYVQGYKQRVGAQPNPEPLAREHAETWPGGRANHYYFDLNRDWAWQTQIETQQRARLYQQWMPHVHADFHEQGVDAPYYFAPAAEPFHAVITPWQRELQTRIGQRNVQTFDAASRLYFTREVFDLFYPSYGDTWPTYNGAIGMTYEQGGSGRAGLAIETSAGDTLTLAQRIANHFATSLNTVAVTAENRAETLDQFRAYFARARRAEGAPYAAYVVSAANGADRLRALTRLLDANNIRYGQAAGRSTAEGFQYRSGAEGRVTVEAGDLVVPAAQPNGTLVQVLFEPSAVLPDTLTYDITAWALPYAYNLDAAALRRPVDTRPYAETRVTPPSIARPYAYLTAWEGMADARLLADLLRHGIRVRAATEPFSIAETSYGPGTLVITRTDNARLGERFDEIVQEAARRHEQPLYPVASGYATQGSDFGARSVAYLEAPRVMVLAGEGLSSLSVGEVWHFFDQQLGYPVTLVDMGDFTPDALAEYDVLVLPSGSYGRVLSSEALQAVHAWVRRGGRLVALEGAARFLAGKDGFGLKATPAAAPDDSVEARLQPYGTRVRRSIMDETPGAVYRVQLDATHPLAFGYPETTFALVRSGAAYNFLPEGWNVGVVRQDARISGFAGANAQARLQDVLLYGVEEKGRGQVVYLLDSPLFRGFWEGGKLLFANAVFMVGQE